MEKVINKVTLLEPIVLSKSPFNRYVLLHIPEPLPTYTFVVLKPLNPLEKPAFKQFAQTPKILKIIYRLNGQLGERGPYVYEYDCWQVD